MRIEVEKMKAKDFIELNRYIDGNDNRYETGTGSWPPMGLKVKIDEIRAVSVDDWPRQVYHGVVIDIDDERLSKEETEEVRAIAYGLPKGFLDMDLFDAQLNLDPWFPVRSTNVFERKGITTLRQLISYSEEDLLKFKNLGKTTVRYIELVLQKNAGLSLKKSDE